MSQLDEKDIERLMNLAGPRPEPPDDIAQRVKANALQAWEGRIWENDADTAIEPALAAAPRRRWQPFAIAACALIAAVALVSTRPQSGGAIDLAGEVIYADGGYVLRGNELGTGRNIAAGALLRTGADGHVNVRLDTRTTLRIAPDSSATLRSKHEIWLHDGRAYVDSTSDEESVVIFTDALSVRDVGTQFEVSVSEGVTEVAVREGAVNLAVASETVRAAANDGTGELVRVAAGQVAREAISSTDPRFDWTHRAVGWPDVWGGSLDELLEVAAREAGRTLVYVTPAAKMQAKQVMVPLPLQHLEFTEVIDAALDTVQRFEVQPGPAHELRIGMRRR